MKPDRQAFSYRVYVLRSWQEGGPSAEAPAVWRFSLEDPATRQRRGFADLESLTSFLASETARGQPWEIGSYDPVQGENDGAGGSSPGVPSHGG